MKRLLKGLLIFVFLFSFQALYAQNPWLPLMEKDGISIDYRWSNEKPFDRNSQLELRLRIRNSNDHHAQLNFSVDFYMGPLLHESSEEVEICLNPGRTLHGRLNGVYFRTTTLTNEQIRSEKFKFEINDLVVTEAAACD